MAKIDFDDLFKVYKVENILSGTTVISSEIDLELPRGYIAKIKKVIIDNPDLPKSMATADEELANSALVLDPDDETTIEIPQDEVQHDVLCDRGIGASISSISNDTAGVHSQFRVEFDFAREQLDVVTARNMRFNSAALGGDFDGTKEQCSVYYTLEKVTDADFLNLLDIL